MPWEEKRPQSWRPERSREPIRQDRSRGLSGRSPVVISPPRASAFGLSPGLESPDPLGRTRVDGSYNTLNFNSAEDAILEAPELDYSKDEKIFLEIVGGFVG